MAISINTKAPLFTLKRKTESGFEELSLADNIGKKQTVLLFFPAAFTGVCQEELCSVSAGLDQYSGLGADVWGISVDLPFAQEAFARASGIDLPLLSDFNKEVSAAYDILAEDFLGYVGVSKRSAFVVNVDGNISYSWSSDDPRQLPPFDEIKAAL